MNKTQIAKTVTSTIVSVGSGTIIAAIINNNVAPKNVTETVTVKVAAFALGGMVGEVASRYTNAKIDQIVAFVQENTKK